VSSLARVTVCQPDSEGDSQEIFLRCGESVYRCGVPTAETLGDRGRKRFQRFLQPGEQLQFAFGAQLGIDPSGGTRATNRIVRVVVTNRAVVLVSTWPVILRMSKVLVRLPRHTVLGPISRDKRWSQLDIPGIDRVAWVARAFYDDVEAADDIARRHAKS
jgi:hypothetical protein